MATGDQQLEALMLIGMYGVRVKHAAAAAAYGGNCERSSRRGQERVCVRWRMQWQARPAYPTSP